MAVGGINKWTLARKAGGIPRVSARFSMSVESEQAGAGRDGRTCLVRPECQARTGTGNILSGIGNLTRLIHTLLGICDDHTYISDDDTYIHTYCCTMRGRIKHAAGEVPYEETGDSDPSSQ